MHGAAPAPERRDRDMIRPTLAGLALLSATTLGAAATPVHQAHADAFCPALVAHRGRVITGDPENTIPAFDAAWKYTDWSEMDVQFTAPTSDDRGGVPVIMHDATVDRTTTGTGSVAKMPYSTFVRLDMKANHNVHPPSLYYTLAEAHAKDKNAEVELKASSITATQATSFVKRFIETGTVDTTIVHSFYTGDLDKVQAAAAKLGVHMTLGLLTYTEHDSPEHYPFYEPEIYPTNRISKAATEKLHAEGARVNYWTADKYPDNWSQAADDGADAVTTGYVATYANWAASQGCLTWDGDTLLL